ncbi:MAG: biopolymer transporter ExbD [bacterium]|nr:biopolymer transporter ExbD [bacterium]
MKLGEYGRPLAEINVTPLVDVVLVVLIIFIVTAPMLRTGVDVSLPKTTKLPSITREGIDVTIRNNGSIYIDQLPVAKENLVEAFKQITSTKPNTPVYLRADVNIPYGDVIQVVDLLREAGVTDLGLVTDASPDRTKKTVSKRK